MKFKLMLSKPDNVITINQRLADGRAVRVPVKTRAVELEIIDSCFNALAKQTRRLADYMQCLRYMKTMQSVTDSVENIFMSKSDIENIINGFELTSGSRPENWSRCIDFFNQLESPEQVEE